jgi:protein-L-isoaspartate(D-aspartate) O-methyltransferase
MACEVSELRAFYARYVMLHARVRDELVHQAFATVPREDFVGPGPWFLPGAPGAADEIYVETPDCDLAFIYQNTLVALDPGRKINNGEPSLHARCLDALALRAGEAVLHVGAGTGYYSAIMARLVGAGGHVFAYEIDLELGRRAAENLAGMGQVSVAVRSGLSDGLPAVDAIYGNAGLGQIAPGWLAALRPGGRLLFPLQPGSGFGGMLLVTRPETEFLPWPARFVCRAGFIPCQGCNAAPERDKALQKAFAGGGWAQVDALHLGTAPDGSCWFDGGGWWLSRRAGSMVE